MVRLKKHEAYRRYKKDLIFEGMYHYRSVLCLVYIYYFEFKSFFNIYSPKTSFCISETIALSRKIKSCLFSENFTIIERTLLDRKDFINNYKNINVWDNLHRH